MTSEFRAFLTAHAAKAREASSKSGSDILIKGERERDLLNVCVYIYEYTQTQTEWEATRRGGEFFVSTYEAAAKEK